MNENPWRIDDIARMQRERIQGEMRQIRLEEKALKAGVRGPGLMARARLRLQAWVKARSGRQAHTAPALGPLTLTDAKPHGRI